jgi:hypothetical protein
MEMMYSGSLSQEQARMIHDYRSNHHDMLLGVPTAYGYNTSDIAGFLSYGHGYGLIQHDMIREALLLTYSVMAHQYTRGTWTAPETRNLLGDGTAAPYCTPAQLVVRTHDPMAAGLRRSRIRNSLARQSHPSRLARRRKKPSESPTPPPAGAA